MTATLRLTRKEGFGIEPRCSGANLWPIWAASYAAPGLAISLRYE